MKRSKVQGSPGFVQIDKGDNVSGRENIQCLA